jgi:hypothetical protein
LYDEIFMVDDNTCDMIYDKNYCMCMRREDLLYDEIFMVDDNTCDMIYDKNYCMCMRRFIV